MLLNALVDMKDSLCKHLDYLVIEEKGCSGSGHALTLSCDLVGFRCIKLFSKPDANALTLKAVIDLGARIKFSDIKELDWFTNKKMIEYLMTMPDGCTFVIKKAVENPDIISMYFNGDFGSPDPQLIDLGELLTASNWHTHPELIQKLVQNGVNPDGTNDKHPLDIVLALNHQTDPQLCKLKMEIISILAKNGADLKRSTYSAKEGTTVVHDATDLAIKTGKETIKCYECL